MNFCVSCGERREPDNRFCSSCGHPHEVPVDQPSPTPDSEPADRTAAFQQPEPDVTWPFEAPENERVPPLRPNQQPSQQPIQQPIQQPSQQPRKPASVPPTQLASALPGQQSDQPNPAGPSKLRYLLIPLIPLFLIGVVFVGYFGVRALLGPKDDQSVSTPLTLPSRTPPPTPSPTPSPTPTDADTFRCWNGRIAPAARACGEPTGRDGAAWVFPNFARQHCAQGPSQEAQRIAIYRCRATVNGQRVRIQYSNWRSNAAARASYEQDQDVTDQRTMPDDRTVYIISARDGSAKAAVVYAGAPWSATVYAPNAQVREAALRTAVAMRPEDQISGTPNS